MRALVNSKKYDVFFNLCDGAKDEDRAGISVVQALEEFGVAFTGSDSRHYEPSKLEMKMLAFYAGIKVPPFAHVTAADNVVEVCSGLRFPLIVKHVSGYGSVGMRKESKCHNFDELHKEAKRLAGRASIRNACLGSDGTVPLLALSICSARCLSRSS